MSFLAHLDNIEDKTGLTPRQFIALAEAKGFDDPARKAGVIVDRPSADAPAIDAGSGWLEAAIEPAENVGDAVTNLPSHSESGRPAAVVAQVVNGLYGHAEIGGEFTSR